MTKLQGKPRPKITIDLKKNRIRVYRETLHMISDPKYIQLLINPKARKIIILGSTAYDHTAHKSYSVMDSHSSFELYSRDLMTQIRQINTDLNEGHSFNFIGRIEQRNTLAVFDICDKRSIIEV